MKNLTKIDFNSFAELWKASLGSVKNDIPPVDSRQYLGSQDPTILDLYAPVFYAVQNSTGSYSAIISGHATSASTYRVRGCCVFDLTKEEQETCVKMLLDALEEEAQKLSCTMLWDLVSYSNILLEYNFKCTEAFKDGLVFITRTISR
jgi:hypothetical protein